MFMSLAMNHYFIFTAVFHFSCYRIRYSQIYIISTADNYVRILSSLRQLFNNNYSRTLIYILETMFIYSFINKLSLLIMTVKCIFSPSNGQQS